MIKLCYKYKINKGISKIQGGVEVLKQLKYPDNIINSAKMFEIKDCVVK